MFTVYILYSRKHLKSYVGFTSNLASRMVSHNELGSDWTRGYRPWEIVQTENFEQKAEAMKREKYLKSGQGRILLKQIIADFLKERPG